MNFLELKNITKIYNTNNLLTIGIKDISLSFNKGEFVVVTGASGSGKSTLLNVIGANDTYEDGELLVNGEATSHFTKEEWASYRQENIAFVFQDFNIIENLTVYENIELALISIKDKKERNKIVLDLIDKVGLTNHKNKKSTYLSGGEKQRCVIARALAKNSPILLCDEPTGNLDQKNSREIAKLLYDISSTKLVIIVSHNKEYFTPYATREIEIYDGGIKKDNQIKDYVSVISETTKDLSEKTKPFIRSLKIATTNYKSRPRFALSLTIAILICMLSIYFIYAFLHKTFVKPITTKLESDALSGKVILTKHNQQAFTLSDKIKLEKLVKKPTIYNSSNTGYTIPFLKKDFIGELSTNHKVMVKFNPNYNLEQNSAIIIAPFSYKRDSHIIKQFIISNIPNVTNVTIRYSFYLEHIELFLSKDTISQYSKLIKGINSFLQIETRQFTVPFFRKNETLEQGKINLINSSIYDALHKDVRLSIDLKSSYIINDDTIKNNENKLIVELSTYDYNRLFLEENSSKSISIYFNSSDEAKFYMEYLNKNYIAVMSNSKTYINDASNIFVFNFFIYIAIIVIGIILGIIISLIFTKSIKVFQTDFIIYKTLGINRKISSLAIYLQMLIIFLPSIILIPLISLITCLIPGLGVSLISFGEYIIIEIIGLAIISIVTLKFIRITQNNNISATLRRGNK